MHPSFRLAHPFCENFASFWFKMMDTWVEVVNLMEHEGGLLDHYVTHFELAVAFFLEITFEMELYDFLEVVLTA